MKVNLCKCGILKNVKSEECVVCKGTVISKDSDTANRLKRRAINKLKIKATNKRNAKI